jgi:uncharacterized protein YjbI with pentapeptide repeats
LDVVGGVAATITGFTEELGAELVTMEFATTELLGVELVGAEFATAELLGVGLLGAELAGAELVTMELLGTELAGIELLGFESSDPRPCLAAAGPTSDAVDAASPTVITAAALSMARLFDTSRFALVIMICSLVGASCFAHAVHLEGTLVEPSIRPSS